MQWGILTWTSGIALNVLHRSYPMSPQNSVGEWSTELLLGLAKRMGCGEDPQQRLGTGNKLSGGHQLRFCPGKTEI